MPDPIYSTDHEREAFRLGADAGRAAASWVDTYDGGNEPIRRVLAMLDDGDPEAYDYLPSCPDLSGEWANAPTPASLASDVGLDADAFGTENDQCIEIDAACAAWEAGVSSTFESECERILRAAL